MADVEAVKSAALDIWEQRWSDCVLQRLGRWLTHQAISDDRATFTVDSVWVFYSYEVLPTFHRYVPLGIGAAEGAQGNHAVLLWLPSPSTPGIGVDVEAKRLDKLYAAFKHEVEAPLAPDPSVKLEVTLPPSLSSFEPHIRDLCKEQGIEYLGVFTDSLKDELKRVLPPGTVDSWLNTPNTLFGGNKPSAYLGDPGKDRPLRELLLSVKHGFVS